MEELENHIMRSFEAGKDLFASSDVARVQPAANATAVFDPFNL